VLVTGQNGVGKTNLLEALHVGSQGFSPRTRVDAQLIRFHAPAGRVTIAGSEGGAPVESQVTLVRGEPKQIRLNGSPAPSAEALRARLSALVFVPDRLAVVKGGPIVRRAYFDRMLGRVEPPLAALPAEYGSALAQRNEALRRLRAGSSSRDAVEPWTERVATLGTDLDAARARLVAMLGPLFTTRADELGLADARLGYEAQPLAAADLDERFDRDLARGATGLGPHLRDVGVTAGARDLRSFGSQGEQRTAVLALVLAEAALLASERGSDPLLLLDDVLSELDESRREALLAALPPGGQTVVTATSERALPRGAATPALHLRVTPGSALAA
jgi:DNA replication and repair protein RecF